MKKLLHRVGCIVLLLAVITLTSCKKEASDGIDNSATNAEAPSGETASGLGNTVDGGSKKPDAVINDDTVGAPSADNTGGGGLNQHILRNPRIKMIFLPSIYIAGAVRW